MFLPLKLTALPRPSFSFQCCIAAGPSIEGRAQCHVITGHNYTCTVEVLRVLLGRGHGRVDVVTLGQTEVAHDLAVGENAVREQLLAVAVEGVLAHRRRLADLRALERLLGGERRQRHLSLVRRNAADELL